MKHLFFFLLFFLDCAVLYQISLYALSPDKYDADATVWFGVVSGFLTIMLACFYDKNYTQQ